MVVDAFAVLHLVLATTWVGSMAYSLGVVQPKVARFFPDEQRREEFLLTLAHGNRRPVVALIVALLITAGGVIATGSRAAAGWYGVATVLYLAAAAVFANVSWRHWPARVFALPAELAGYRARLARQAWAMLGLVGTAYLIALINKP